MIAYRKKTNADRQTDTHTDKHLIIILRSPIRGGIVSGVLLKMEVDIRKGALAKGLKVPCLFMITEVTIRCQKNPGGWYTAYTRVYPPIHHWE